MGSPRILKISVRVTAKGTVVDLEGGIDIHNSTDLRRTLFEALPSTTSRVALNMSGVDYIDSSGIATMVEVLKKAQDLKRDFVLFGLGHRVYEVLRLTHLVTLFHIFDDEASALEGAVNG